MFGMFTFAGMYFADGPGHEATPVEVGMMQSDKFTLGTKESVSVTGTPTIGGWWGW